jgi:hypothetical protein
VIGELLDHALVVRVSNSELQPESHDEFLKENREPPDNWYHLTPLGLEFVRSMFEEDGPPLLAPVLIADDLMGFINGLPDESRRIDEHLVRTDDAYETEEEFRMFRKEVREGEYTGTLVPPFVPEEPYLFSREVDVGVYEGGQTTSGIMSLNSILDDALQDCAQVRLFTHSKPPIDIDMFDQTRDLEHMFHQLIVGRSFTEVVEGDDEGAEPETEFFENAQEYSDLRVETTDRYLPYMLGIFENKGQTESELVIWGRGNPDTDTYEMVATGENPAPPLYEWADNLFEYVEGTTDSD